MEQTLPTEIQTPIPTVEPVQKMENLKPKKSGGFLVILLSILLIISVLIAGFFAYQTQNLVKEITKLQVTPTPIASIEPLPTNDPTVDWEIYTNKKLGFEIKYPNNFTISNKLIPNNGTQTTLISDQRNILIINRPNINPLTNEKYESLEEFDPRVKDYKSILIGQNEAKDSETYTTQGATTQRDLIMEKDNSIWIIQDIQKEESTNEIFDQILSTFKFINEVVCTADAKMCPDGSAVGRIGPKCEFAPCPTTSPQPSPLTN